MYCMCHDVFIHFINSEYTVHWPIQQMYLILTTMT